MHGYPFIDIKRKFRRKWVTYLDLTLALNTTEIIVLVLQKLILAPDAAKID